MQAFLLLVLDEDLLEVCYSMRLTKACNLESKGDILVEVHHGLVAVVSARSIANIPAIAHIHGKAYRESRNER